MTWHRYIGNHIPGLPPPQPYRIMPRPVNVQPTHIDRFTMDNIIGDGNCYFRAISKALCGSERHHLIIRKKITTFLQTDSLHFALCRALWVDDRSTQWKKNNPNYDFRQAVQDMRTARVWSEEWVIQATASYLHTPIHVYIRHSVHNSWDWAVFQPGPRTPYTIPPYVNSDADPPLQFIS